MPFITTPAKSDETKPLFLKDVFTVKSPNVCLPDNSLVMSNLNIGIEIEVEGWDSTTLSLWENHADDSLRNSGQEFTCGPVYGDTITKALEELCSAAKAKNWQSNVRTGMHFHLDCSRQSFAFLKALAMVYVVAENTLFKLAGQWRRWCNFCYSLEEAEQTAFLLREFVLCSNSKTAIKLLDGNAKNKYSAINFYSLAKYGTVEFRINNTTFDKNEILNWINVYMSIYKTAEIVAKENIDLIDMVKNLGPAKTFEFIFGHKPSTYDFVLSVYTPDDVRKSVKRLKYFYTDTMFVNSISSTHVKTLSDSSPGNFYVDENVKPVTNHLMGHFLLHSSTDITPEVVNDIIFTHDASWNWPTNISIAGEEVHIYNLFRVTKDNVALQEYLKHYPCFIN